MVDAQPVIHPRTPRRASTKSYLETRRRFPVATKANDPEVSWEAKAKEYVNTQTLDDPFEGQYLMGSRVGNALDVIQPPYNFYALARVPYENSSLLACIDAMVRNCHGHGWQLEYVGPDGQQDSSEAKAEKATIEKLLRYPNDEYSLQELCERARFDKESMGCFYIEAPRARNGQIASLHHIPAQTMRLTFRDRTPVQVEVKLPRDGSDTSIVTKRFRRFVQLVGEKRVYFKEFGDPRLISSETGLETPNLPLDKQATEVIYGAIYYPVSPYGVPRWINQLPSILGSRQAELTNYDFFKDNAVPAMAVLVSGGVLTGETLDNIEEQFSAIKGRRSVHRMVFLEARGDEDLASQDGQVPIPKLELKPLREAQQQDALFQKYEEDSEAKVRSSFRLPPLMVGRSQDVTFATAQTSYEVAEGQIFGPERRQFDEMMDMKVLSSFNAKYWAFRSQPAKITDTGGVVNALTAFNNMGALTPNIAIRLANELFDMEIPTIAEEWGNWPFDVVKDLAQKGQLIGLDKIADIPDPLKLAAASAPKPVPGEPGANDNAKPDAGNDKANANDQTGKGKPVSAAARMMVARSLQDLRDILKGEESAEQLGANDATPPA